MAVWVTNDLFISVWLIGGSKYSLTGTSDKPDPPVKLGSLYCGVAQVYCVLAGMMVLPLETGVALKGVPLQVVMLIGAAMLGLGFTATKTW